MNNNESLDFLWQQEYRRRGIPSSYREDPTSTLVYFLSFLKSKGFQGTEALDLGCGLGRNTFYLAYEDYRVTCFDCVDDNIQLIKEKTSKMQLPITALCQDVARSWPVQEQQFDIAIDIFCYKHIINKHAQRSYRKSLHTTLKSSGYYFLNLAADDDGFYGPLLATSPNLALKYVIDPHSHIPSFLYNLDEVIEEFSDYFHPIEAKKISSISPMHGKEFQRQVLSLIFQKK